MLAQSHTARKRDWNQCGSKDEDEDLNDNPRSSRQV
jgi:hypothetical protein